VRLPVSCNVRVKLFFNCVSRVEENLLMDFFLRNDTCYYILKREKGTK